MLTGLVTPAHLLLLLGVLLLLFGAKRVPEMGRSLGAGLRGFKESLNGEPGSVLSPGEPVARDESAQPVSAERASTT